LDQPKRCVVYSVPYIVRFERNQKGFLKGFKLMKHAMFWCLVSGSDQMYGL
jgi:hypothetical protein